MLKRQPFVFYILRTYLKTSASYPSKFSLGQFREHWEPWQLYHKIGWFHYKYIQSININLRELTPPWEGEDCVEKLPISLKKLSAWPCTMAPLKSLLPSGEVNLTRWISCCLRSKSLSANLKGEDKVWRIVELVVAWRRNACEPGKRLVRLLRTEVFLKFFNFKQVRVAMVCVVLVIRWK